MASLVDEIQAFIESRLRQGRGEATLRRAEVADRFGCAPSQISYVLETRFSLDRGYLVESRRGGGGYVRVKELQVPGWTELVRRVDEAIGDRVAEDRALGAIEWIARAGLVDRLTAAVMQAAVRRETLAVPLPLRDEIRARVLRAMVRAAAAARAGPRQGPRGAG
ncbi:MAG: CtsR family transcriptional regulator [Clostridia bacterium]|nr:CtsR family transcriptional regulator [Clostridia bacterium]